MLRKTVIVVILPAILLAACAAPTPSQAPSPTPEAAVFPTPAPMLVFPDIPYEQIDGADPNLLNLDIYTPLAGGPGTPRPVGVYPVVVLIHGGSWREGDKRNLSVTTFKSSYFITHGIVFVSINYRLSPTDKYPAPVKDVAAALAWIHAYIARYGGDPARVYLMGHSSGGQLAALVATDERYLAAHDLKLDAIHGVILLDGVGLNIPALVTPSTSPMYTNAFGTDPVVWRDASPLYHVAAGKGIPAFLIFYAVENGQGQATGQEMADALTAAGVQNWFVAAEERSHATIVDDIGTPGDPVTARIMEFIDAMKP